MKYTFGFKDIKTQGRDESAGVKGGGESCDVVEEEFTMLRKCLAIVSENCPAAHMRAYRDVSVLSHRREPPNGEPMAEQVDVVDGLYSPSAGAQPHVGREQGTPQCGYNGRSQYDVAEVMVLRTEVRARDVGPCFVIPDRPVKEVQTNAVGSVRTAHFGVEVIERAAVVLVDVSVLDKDPLGSVRKLILETLCDALRIELGVKHNDETVIVCRGSNLDPFVGHQCDSSLSVSLPERRTVTGR